MSAYVPAFSGSSMTTADIEYYVVRLVQDFHLLISRARKYQLRETRKFLLLVIYFLDAISSSTLMTWFRLRNFKTLLARSKPR